MTTNNLIAPIVITCLTGVITLLTQRHKRTLAFVSFTGSLSLLYCAINLLIEVTQHHYLVLQLGNWPAPFAISFVADRFSALMLVVTAILGLTGLIYAHADQSKDHKYFHAFYHWMLMGVCGAILTGDLFNLFVWFEVMLISSFVLLTLGNRVSQLHGAVRYVTINLLASALFLCGAGLVYAKLGTLNLADIAQKMQLQENPALVMTSATFLFLAFGIKAGVFPLFYWLPASYHTPTYTVSAIFSGLLTKVGLYAMIRVFTLIYTQHIALTHHFFFGIIACLTMIIGVFGAVSQWNIRKLLSFHIISQIGYMMLGLALFTPFAIASTIFYMTHHMFVKTNLFFAAGVLGKNHQHENLAHLGDALKQNPLLAALFAVAALSLAGIPPLSGFFAKLTILQASFTGGYFMYGFIALFVGFLTLYSMLKIWLFAFWQQNSNKTNTQPLVKSASSAYLAMGILACLTIYLGFFPAQLFEYTQAAAHQLMTPANYIHAVLGQKP